MHPIERLRYVARGVGWRSAHARARDRRCHPRVAVRTGRAGHRVPAHRRAAPDLGSAVVVLLLVAHRRRPVRGCERARLRGRARPHARPPVRCAAGRRDGVRHRLARPHRRRGHASRRHPRARHRRRRRGLVVRPAAAAGRHRCRGGAPQRHGSSRGRRRRGAGRGVCRGVDEMLVATSSRAAASVAYCAEVPVWLVAGRGRRLAGTRCSPRCWNASPTFGCRGRPLAEPMPLALVGTVAGPTAVSMRSRPTCSPRSAAWLTNWSDPARCEGFISGLIG